MNEIQALDVLNGSKEMYNEVLYKKRGCQKELNMFVISEKITVQKQIEKLFTKDSGCVFWCKYQNSFGICMQTPI